MMNLSSSGKRVTSKDEKGRKKKAKFTCLVINDQTMHPHLKLSVDRVEWRRCYIELNEYLHYLCCPVMGHTQCQLDRYFGH